MIRRTPGLEQSLAESAQVTALPSALAPVLVRIEERLQGAPPRATTTPVPGGPRPPALRSVVGAPEPTGETDDTDTPTEPIEERIHDLWRDYVAHRGRHQRDRLVVHYTPLVRGVAGRMAGGLPSYVDLADLVQSGVFGLLDAIERFDPERCTRFESYAAQRIRGAILDELRAQDWVPRTVRGRIRELERVQERLEGRLGRAVAPRELAAELGITLRELRGMACPVQLVSVEALDEGAGTIPVADMLADDSVPDPMAVVQRRETSRQLSMAVGQLGERDRLVVRLYYLENRTLAEIGRMLGVTESRVCQLHTRLVTRLRGRLEELAAG
ncbi:FliA/WhiG family RNA polymerase sigma factor [Pseudonocardia acidicola]|uniref:RNA polymerase sigma factor n=1 Tax=Pseudonocardia acidicola TaxID=2724939 RepID=A0ABX1S6M8_9PSEU|nr:FliA/WhiG family RNA polymerase sigma factor [Pseudonocardia acidicola]NMH96123.1 FliA/WhiG family RNA polymerase sigma factor [Pseudonocardia acidicola]